MAPGDLPQIVKPSASPGHEGRKVLQMHSGEKVIMKPQVYINLRNALATIFVLAGLIAQAGICSVVWAQSGTSPHYTLRQFGMVGGVANSPAPARSSQFELPEIALGGISGDTLISPTSAVDPGFLGIVPPEIKNETGQVKEDESILINVLQNDYDPNGYPLTVVRATAVNGGSLESPTDSTLRYTPEPNATGTVSILYYVSNGTWIDSATVIITVNPRNDPPARFALRDPPDQTRVLITNESLTDTLAFAWEGATDPEGDPVTYLPEVTEQLTLLPLPETKALSWRLATADVLHLMEAAGVDSLEGGWTVLATDSQDTTSASNGPWTLSIINTVDFLPPLLQAGLLQNPVMQQYLDLYISASESLDVPPRIQLGGEPVATEAIPDVTAHMYHAALHISTGGVQSLTVSGRDPAQNETTLEYNFSLGKAGPDHSTRIGVPGTALTLEIPPQIAGQEGSVYVFPWDPRIGFEKPSHSPHDSLTMPEGLDSLAIFRIAGAGASTAPFSLELPGSVAGDSCGFYRYTGANWISLPTYTDEQHRRVWTYTRAPGVFGVFAGDTPPAVIPTELRLYQNYPNPFRVETTIVYTIPGGTAWDQMQGQPVRLTIYDLRGQVVRLIVNEPQLPRQYTLTWDGRNDLGLPVSSGIYFVHLATPEHQLSRKMLYVK